MSSSATVNDRNAIDRVMKLLAIPGGSCRESQVSEHLQSVLSSAGVPASSIHIDTAHRRSPAGGDTGNLIVKLKGTRKGPRRLLMAHMDTVPLAVGCEPVRDGDWIRPKSPTTALGGDNRAGCAVVLTAVLEALSQGLSTPPLTLLFSIQEEIGLRGVRFMDAAKLGNPELCFNWDGRDPAALIIGAVGASNLTIRISGIASHAGVHPELGVNALVAASIAISDLQQNGWHGLVIKAKKRGTSNIGVIQGGDATNVVLPLVELHAEARSHDPAFRDRIVSEFRKAFARAVKQLKTADGRKGSFTFEEDQRYQAFRIDAASPCVAAASAAAVGCGLQPEVLVCDGGLDANWLAEHGYPTVTMGCGQHQIHTVDEQLSILQYLTACRMGLALATGNIQDGSAAVSV